MKVVCIIQARRGSQRLKDKILKSVCGKTILQYVIERTSLIDGVDQVVCASVDDEYNRPVLEHAKEVGADVFAGSEHDVLDRYYQAAVQYKADAVMRVTADCPLLDPFVCGQAVQLLRKGGVGYSAVGGGWPHGMDCEVFSFEWLERTHQEATLLEDREHVTLWMKRHPDLKRAFVEPDGSSLHDENRWVIDYLEDYEFLKKLSEYAPGEELPLRWQDTLALVGAHPELRDINRNCAIEWKEATDKIFEEAKQKSEI